MFQTAPFGSHCLAQDGSFTEINDMELSWLDRQREDVVGRTSFRQFLTPASQLKLDHYLAAHQRHGFIDLELELYREGAEPLLVAVSFNGTLTDEGQRRPGRYVLFDLTALQRERTIQKYAAMSFESACGICVTNALGIILRVNAAFTTLTGFTNDEVVGKNMAILSSGLQSEQFYQAMWKAIETRGYWQGEIRNRRKNGHLYTEWLSIASVKNPEGLVTNYVGTFYDITAAKASQEEMHRLAFHDELTHLPNRRLLQQHMEHTLALNSRNGKLSALLFIDLDHFKAINDTRGHEAGDLLLIQAARRMQTLVREGDTVARVGGDEFVVLLEGLDTAMNTAAAQAQLVGEKLLAMLATPYAIRDFKFRCTASIGIRMVSFGDHASQLLTHADLAMYEAKKNGRNSLRFFDPTMQAAATVRAHAEQDLQRAVENGEFELFYQPQVDAQGKMVGAEALLRWHHPERGLVSPGEVIPLAEETGLIIPIGNWVMKTACAQLKRWATLPEAQGLTMAVNVSARQFAREDFVNFVLKVLEDTQIDPTLLELEVTESMMLDIDTAAAKMQALRTAGVRFSVDDFGTGYSSLAHLTRIPIAKLKIDQSFVQHMGDRQADLVIVQTVIAMAHSLGLCVVAEGVETPTQHQQLLNDGCNVFQGYLFGRPQPSGALERQLLQGNPPAG
ncbi:putative bifunctional diguanylate cyclase/phosphodiesterase [Hydrogenophaga atypica]|uniref:Bifunctional diguanylate cyclase/phosphodiesterase n=2 Tax=Hydrogenophaga atypica TaxID=249409 RepID=A0ABW2QQ97_9BURK